MAIEALPPSSGRVKRQVVARTHRFAMICPPGFEDLCLDEARFLGLGVEADAVPSSAIEWNGRLTDLYRACLFSRLASRFLVRLDEFHAGAREELFRKATAFPWELWLSPQHGLRIDSHVAYSRISHEGQAAATLGEAIRRRMLAAGVSLVETETLADFNLENDDETESWETQPAQRVIMHITENQVRLSLDACGEHLHRRGWRLAAGAAPIRENLAAGLLRAAGWPDRHSQLLDGMCGSGTFAIEAAGLARGSAAGLGRDFAFCHWPSFESKTFAWLQRQIIPTMPEQIPQIIFANELAEPILRQAQSNAQRSGFAAQINWQLGDFFDLEPGPVHGLLVLNPPYGMRLSDQQGSLYPRIIKRLAETWRGWDILLLGPVDTALSKLKSQIAWQRTFRHGGLRITAWLLKP